MHLSSPLRLFLRSLFIGALILCVPVLAFLVLYAEPFEPLRRTMTEKLLSEAMGTKMEVRGPIHISSDWFPTVRIEDIFAVESEQPPDLKRLSVKSIKSNIYWAMFGFGQYFAILGNLYAKLKAPNVSANPISCKITGGEFAAV